MINVFTKNSSWIIMILCMILSGNLQAQQYKFNSKSDKKLYAKLENAYDEADYEFILENESKLLSSFETKQDTLSALVYSFLGEAYYAYYGDLAKGLTFYNKELELRKKIQPNIEFSDTYFTLASINKELGYYDESEKLYLQLLKADEKKYGKKSEEYITSSINLAINYTFSLESEKGIKVLKGIEKNLDKTSELYPRTYLAYGYLYRDLGSYKKAMKNLNKALKSYEELGLTPCIDCAGALSAMYEVLADQGKFPEAEDRIKGAIDMLERMQGGTDGEKSILYHNLAEVYRLLGNYEDASRYINLSMDIIRDLEGDDSPSLAEDYSTLALIYYNQKRYQEAEETINKGLKVLSDAGYTDDIVYYGFQSNLANVYKNSGRIPQGIELRKQSAEGYKNLLGPDNFEYAYELHRLGEAYQANSDLKNAEKNLSEGLKVRKNTLGKYHPLYAQSTKQLAILKWKQNQAKKANGFFEETFDNYFKQIDAYFPTLSEEEKAKFYNNNIKLSFEQFNSFAIANLETFPELASKMYNYQLSTKGLIMYATARVRDAILNSENEELIEKYNEWIAQKEQLSKLFSKHEEDLEIRNAKIDKLLESSNELEKELSKLSADFSRTFAKSAYTWKDVQKKLKEGEAAIEIIRFREFTPDSAGQFNGKVKYAALIVSQKTTENPDLVVLENGDKMETRYLANYRNAIRYKVNEKYSYKLFWEPISKKLGGINKVYFSPDGVYNQISIYTLRNPATKKFLLDEIDLQLVTNTKDLVAFNPDDAAKFDERKAYLFGFPNYNMGIVEENNSDPDKIQEAAQKIAEAASLGRGTSRGGSRGTRSGSGNTRSGGLSRGIRGNLQRYVSSNSLLALLPGTEREVNAISAL